METARLHRILLYGNDEREIEVIHRSLEEAGHAVKREPARTSEWEDIAAFQAIVLEGGSLGGDPVPFCRRLRWHLGESFTPVLFLAASDSSEQRSAILEAGADACLPRPYFPDEVVGQVGALLRIKDRHDRLAARTSELQHTTLRLQRAHQQVNQELELARRIQQSFLPRALPDLPQVRFAVHYQPCGRVGGDFYDIFRLDEHHIGFYVADAMGHGVPASLLTMFLKKAVRAKEIFHNEYRLVPPGEVLQRLNRDLIEQGLIEDSFITMVYALLNTRDGVVQFARAGHPHPVYVPRDGDVEVWTTVGSLLGVFETTYSGRDGTLRPGDKMLFFTDGTDEFSFQDRPSGNESFLACVAHHRDQSIGALVESLARELSDRDQQSDDFTLLGLEILPHAVNGQS